MLKTPSLKSLKLYKCVEKMSPYNNHIILFTGFCEETQTETNPLSTNNETNCT